MDKSNRLISVKAAAERLGVSIISVYRWTEKGRLASIKLGSRRLVSEQAIEALIAEAMGERN